MEDTTAETETAVPETMSIVAAERNDGDPDRDLAVPTIHAP